MDAEMKSAKTEKKSFPEWMKKLEENGKLQKTLAEVSGVLILLFLLLITLGSYIKIKKAVIIVFLILTVVMAIPKSRTMLRDFIKSPLMMMWLGYCLIGFLSGLFIKHEEDFYIVYTQISFTFILFTLTRYYNPENFAKMFRAYVTWFVLLAIFQDLTGICPFKFLKEGTPYPYEDLVTRGVSAIFESRHYFGCYMLAALFSLVWFPEKSIFLNIFYGALLLVGVVITYTRSVWIAVILCGLIVLVYAIYTFSQKPRKLKKKSTKLVLTAVGIFVLVCAAVAVIFRAEISSMLSNVVVRFKESFDTKNGSFATRVYNIKNGVAYILQNWQQDIWIGMGNGSAIEWLAQDAGAKWREAVDCQYVTTFMETGIIGLLLLLAMIFETLRFVFVRKSKSVKWFSLCFIGICLAFSFFEVITVSSSIFALFMLTLVGASVPDEKKIIMQKEEGSHAELNG